MAFLLHLCGLLRGCSGKAIVFAALILGAAAASAACFEYRLEPNPWRSSAQAACNDAGGGAEVVARNVIGTEPNFVCSVDVRRDDGSGVNVGHRQFTILGREAAQCDDQCKETIGQMSTMNFTRGWARSPLPNKPDQLGPTSAVPKRVCGGPKNCPYAVLGNEEAYRSQTPSPQGLYRLSSDITVIQVEGSCTPTDDAAAVNPATPDKPCPGSLGELNGKPYCAVAPDTAGVDPVGAPGNQPDDKGNPTAGPKPSAGQGSGTGGVGRTPATGSGGNMGGPAGAAAGGSGTKPGTAPDGKTDKPEEGKEQQACGAPGQPKCQIDETGTPPVANDKYDKAADQYKTDRDTNRGKIAGTDDKGFFDGWRSFWFAPPVASCIPFQFPGFLGAVMPAVDACEVVDGVRRLMAYLWALTALYLCVGMVSRTIRGGS